MTEKIQLSKNLPILIGEVGLAHEGSLGIAMNMAKNAKDYGLEAVKFQMHDVHEESTSQELFRVKIFPQDSSRLEYWERTSFTIREWEKLANFCAEIGIEFLCTPFSIKSAKILRELGCQKIKIGSGDSLNFELLEYCKKNFNQVLVSLGMSFTHEINQIVSYFKDEPNKLILMQCTSLYPTPLQKVGLGFIQELKLHGVKVGLSDHTGNKNVLFSSVTRDITYLEFHLAYSRIQFGADAFASITFEEAQEVVQFRDVWYKVHDPFYNKDEVSKSLESTRFLFGRSLALKNPMKKGEIVVDDNLTLKKPAGHLAWNEKDKIIGKRALFDIDILTPLNESLFE